MATTIVRNGKTITLTIEQKARLLEVVDIQEENCLAVRSGSKSGTAYGVQHNNTRATYCPCEAGKYGSRCCHKVAVNWHLEALRRELVHVFFDPCMVA